MCWGIHDHDDPRFGCDCHLFEDGDSEETLREFAAEAWRAGYEAEDGGYTLNANPFDPVLCDVEHDAWVRGFHKSERDRRPAME